MATAKSTKPKTATKVDQNKPATGEAASTAQPVQDDQQQVDVAGQVETQAASAEDTQAGTGDGEQASQQSKKVLVKGLHVVAKRDGFRRAGRAWGTSGETVPLADLTDEQVAQLASEPMLTVTEVDLEGK